MASKQLPPRSKRLSPATLGGLFTQSVLVDPDQPGEETREARTKRFAGMSLEEQKRLLVEAQRKAEEKYAKATGYNLEELIPWSHGIQLITGTNRPSTAEARLRSHLPVIIEEEIAHRPENVGPYFYVLLSGEPEIELRQTTIDYEAFIAQ